MFDPALSRHTQIASEWLANSALGFYADAYVQYLTERGYAAGTIRGYFGSIAHFAHWLARQKAGLADIGEELISRFLDKHLLRCRCAPRCSRTRTVVRAALGHLLKMLRANGHCTPRHSTVPGAIAAELENFDCFLTDVRGLSTTTRSARRRYLRDFLIDRFGTGPVQLSSLGPADVTRFMEHYTSGLAPGSIKQAGTSLRSYFAFRATRGEQAKALAAALPRVAQWRLALLPQVLSAQEITQLLNAFDRSTATSKRDYAIVRCLLDLGLRRTEVARLRLEDVDWRAGTLRIHTKGKRIDVLPLPQKTGIAIAAYLQDWDKFQLAKFDISISFLTLTDNVGTAESNGFEGDFSYLVNDNWTLSGALSYNKAEITEDYWIDKANEGDGNPDAPKGLPLPNAPEWKWNVATRYNMEMMGRDSYIQAAYIYVGESWNELFSGSNDVRTRDLQKSYNILNLTWGLEGEDWSAELFARNLFDERGQVNINGSNWDKRITINRPRTFGVRYRKRY